MLIHASCAASGGQGVLLLGASGSGKSDLLLRLIGRGFDLVADDQVEVTGGVARPPARLAGLIEVRGLGIYAVPWRPEVALVLAVQLRPPTQRIADRIVLPELNLPAIPVNPWAVSAADVVILALKCLRGTVAEVAGPLGGPAPI